MKSVQTDKAPAAIGPYSQAVIANGFVFCSGQVGVDSEKNIVVEGVEAQTHQILKNLSEVLKAAGSDLSHVVKTTIYLKNVSDFAKVNEVYAQYFADSKPARATVEVSNLPKGKFLTQPLIEIEAIASCE